MRPARTIGPLLAFIGVILAAINLRPGVSSIGPVMESVLAALGASSSIGGVITAIPGLVFFLCGMVAVRLAGRVGLTAAVLGGLSAITIGLLARPWVTSPTLFLLLTAVAVAGIAVGNVLLPAWIKVHGGERSVTLMTAHTSTLALGGAIGPLSALMFGADDVINAPAHGTLASPAPWQLALGFWGLIAIPALVVWLLTWGKVRYDYPPSAPSSRGAGAMRRSSTAVALMIFFGTQSMNAYIQMGWLPTMIVSAGARTELATWAAMLAIGMALIGGLVMPTVVARSPHVGRYVAIFALANALGWGLVIALHTWGADQSPTATPILAGLMLGIGGFCFPTVIALIPARTKDPEVTARLSGFVQPIGYILAAAGPFLVGFFADILDGWTLILWCLIGLATAMGIAGVRAARGSSVDAELSSEAA